MKTIKVSDETHGALLMTKWGMSQENEAVKELSFDEVIQELMRIRNRRKPKKK